MDVTAERFRSAYTGNLFEIWNQKVVFYRADVGAKRDSPQV